MEGLLHAEAGSGSYVLAAVAKKHLTLILENLLGGFDMTPSPIFPFKLPLSPPSRGVTLTLTLTLGLNNGGGPLNRPIKVSGATAAAVRPQAE